MKSPALKFWNKDVDEARLGAALAALGILLADGADLETEAAHALVVRLVDVLAKQRFVPWQEPTLLEQPAAARLPSASEFEAIWFTATAHISRPATLELSVRPRYANWYLARFGGLSGISRAHVYLRPTSAHIDWRWPMQVGVVAGKDERRLREDLTQLRTWTNSLVKVVDVCEPDAAVDFLFVDGSGNVEERLRCVRYPILANCLVICGAHARQWAKKGTQFQRAAALVQAKGVVLTPLSVGQIPRWFTELIRELSHNRRLDDALECATATVNGRPGDHLLATSELLLHVTGFVHLVDKLVDGLTLAPGSIELNGRMSTHLGLESTPRVMRLRDLSGLLRNRRDQFKFYRESDEATTLSQIASAMKGAPKRRAGQGEPRWLQHRLKGAQSGQLIDSRETLRLRRRYCLGIRIAPTAEDGWAAADDAFPQHQLPIAENGHLLTVVFSEPHSISVPLVQTLFLPCVGASSECEFLFTIKPGRSRFEGRVIVMHANRVLQTWLLCRQVASPTTAKPLAATLERTSSDSGEESGFYSEAVIRSFAPPLPPYHAQPAAIASGQPAANTGDVSRGEISFGAALVLNHSGDGVPRATYVRGLKASLISLAGLQAAVDGIKITWDGANWEDTTKYRELGAPETAALLRDLSVRGKLLHQALTLDERIDPILANRAPLQVVAARVDAHLPIEFCYSRVPARPGAALCPHATASLSGGPCCSGGCQVPDDGSVVCPVSFWGLSRVIEWHRYDKNDRRTMDGSDFALLSGIHERQPLQPLHSILLGASSKIAAADVRALRDRVKTLTRRFPAQAISWSDWERRVLAVGPSLLILMVHVDSTAGLPKLELKDDLRDYFGDTFVRQSPHSPKPVVFLLGCGTGVMDVPFQGFTTQFRQAGAAIVVSTIAELLSSHAPQLAGKLIETLATNAAGTRRFGEVMLALKRACLRDGMPIALALLTYGDADWSI